MFYEKQNSILAKAAKPIKEKVQALLKKGNIIQKKMSKWANNKERQDKFDEFFEKTIIPNAMYKDIRDITLQIDAAYTYSKNKIRQLVEFTSGYKENEYTRRAAELTNPFIYFQRSTNSYMVNEMNAVFKELSQDSVNLDYEKENIGLLAQINELKSRLHQKKLSKTAKKRINKKINKANSRYKIIKTVNKIAEIYDQNKPQAKVKKSIWSKIFRTKDKESLQMSKNQTVFVNESLSKICNVFSYYMMFQLHKKEKKDFSTFYKEEIQKGNITLNSQNKGLSYGIGSNKWEKELKMKRIDAPKSTITESEDLSKFKLISKLDSKLSYILKEKSILSWIKNPSDKNNKFPFFKKGPPKELSNSHYAILHRGCAGNLFHSLNIAMKIRMLR